MKARIPQGMGGGPQNMNAMIRQAQKMQEDMAALQEELDAREYTVTAGGGMVTVVINGQKEILSIDIKPEIVDPDDIETLTDILTAGVNGTYLAVGKIHAYRAQMYLFLGVKYCVRELLGFFFGKVQHRKRHTHCRFVTNALQSAELLGKHRQGFDIVSHIRTGPAWSP